MAVLAKCFELASNDDPIQGSLRHIVHKCQLDDLDFKNCHQVLEADESDRSKFLALQNKLLEQDVERALLFGCHVLLRTGIDEKNFHSFSLFLHDCLGEKTLVHRVFAAAKARAKTFSLTDMELYYLELNRSEMQSLSFNGRAIFLSILFFMAGIFMGVLFKG